MAAISLLCAKESVDSEEYPRSKENGYHQLREGISPSFS
jgi:hypothetical protein